MRSSTQGGFTYIGVLIAIAVLGVGLMALSEAWVATAHHQRLQQLNWVGQQYLTAIGSYHDSSPNGLNVYPRTLEELIEDQRTVPIRRHLRQVHANPFSGTTDWELVLSSDGGIRGVSVVIASPLGGEARELHFVHVPLRD